MKFAETFISDDGISNTAQIKKMLENNSAVPGIFCICLSDCSSNILDIISCTQLVKKPFKNSGYTVIGFARGREQAFLLVRKIFQDCLDSGIDISALKKDLLGRFLSGQEV